MNNTGASRLRWVAAISVLLLLGRGALTSHSESSIASATAGEVKTILGTAFATDGDTIKLDGKVRVRLSGVAAPERYEAGGAEATDYMARLVNGQTVRCELNGTRSHNRVVGTCFVGSRDIGKAVIAAGLARDCPRFSHGRYADDERSEAAFLPLPRYCLTR